jgi:AP-3 complex subunit delta-1
MEGYDMAWACFYMLELMSAQKFSQKRIGFMTASHCFSHNQDILMLTTNLFRRECASSNFLETSLAVNCLACVINPDLARDLLNDFTALITTSRPILRKKVTILFFKIFLNYPESLNSAFERIAERLRDDNPSVVMGAVNTIYEVARKNPRYVLFAVRSLHDLLLSTTSNWLLIKLIKLFTILCQVEPRLVKKMVEPIYKTLQSNSAKSVEFECIRCITEVFSEFQHLTSLAVAKLQGFLDSNDMNLRYLGLEGLFLLFTKQISISQDYRSYVVESMASHDDAIRLKGLELLKIMVSC